MNKLEYETDYYKWTQLMAKALRERDYSSIDWDNLIEEIEDMGKSQKRAIESLLMRLTEHLLKLKYWQATPRRRQAQGNTHQDKSPSSGATVVNRCSLIPNSIVSNVFNSSGEVFLYSISATSLSLSLTIAFSSGVIFD